jgi:hypothetical protein
MPSIDVVFPFSDMWLLPYLRHAMGAVVNQDYPRELIKIYVSYYYNPRKNEPVGDLAELCKEADAVLVMNKWKDPAFSRGQAFNAGIRCGHGEVIACLDADVVIHRGTFEYLRPRLNVGQGVVLTVGRTPLRPEQFTSLSDAEWEILAEKSPHSRNALGNILMRRSQVEAVNGYDERYYGWGGGDTELWLRLQTYGVVIYSLDIGCQKALHLWHRTTQTKETKLTVRNRKMLAHDKSPRNWMRPVAVVQNTDGIWGQVTPSREKGKV